MFFTLWPFYHKLWFHAKFWKCPNFFNIWLNLANFLPIRLYCRNYCAFGFGFCGNSLEKKVWRDLKVATLHLITNRAISLFQSGTLKELVANLRQCTKALMSLLSEILRHFLLPSHLLSHLGKHNHLVLSTIFGRCGHAWLLPFQYGGLLSRSIFITVRYLWQAILLLLGLNKLEEGLACDPMVQAFLLVLE